MADGYISQITLPDNTTYLLKDSQKTDEKVKQTLSSTNAEYKLLSTTTASPTSGTAYGAYYDSDITINPSTHTITAPNFRGDLIHTQSFTSNNMVLLPYDGYASASGTKVGAIKITLPVSWTATMLSMKVDIYNYNDNNCTTYTIGGYNYTGGDGYWANCSSSSVGYGDKTNLNVRFGHDGTKCCIIIGEVDTSWSYPKVQVRNVLLGHSGTALSNWTTGWAVEWITTLPENIDVTKSNPGIIPISHGGTGQTTAAKSWTALGGGESGKHPDSYFAKASHGNHVPETQTANNITFLRNDNSWYKLTKNEVNTLINLLDTGNSYLTANDYVITQYVGGGTTTTTYHRRPASAVVNATLVKAALGTDTSTTNQWLNKKGEWSTPTAAQVGAAASGHDHTLKIGNKSLTVNTSEQTWSVHDILKTTTNIGTSTSWNQYEPGVYYVSSSSAFTGDNNPENTNTNNGIQPYRYGQLIVSRAGNGGIAEFYISHQDSNSASYGIHYRTGWNNAYVAKWSVLLDSHNYTNYTVTKTGTGASGTWGISITGNAANITGTLALANFTKGAANTALMGKGTSSDPAYVSVSPSISITDGTSSAAPKINLTVLGISGTAQDLTIASTSAYGVTKLYDGVNSSSTEMAATAKAVKTAYDKAVNIIAESNALVYKGTRDGNSSSSNGGAYTPAANCGDVYIVSTAGYINGLYVELGDMLICNTDETVEATSSNYTTIRNKWDIIQTSNGAVSTSETSVAEGEIPVFKGTTGRFIQNSEKSFTVNAPTSSSGDSTIPTSKAVWTTVNTAITGLDVAAVGGGTGEYVSKISEADGKISATISTTSVSNTWTAGTTAGPTIKTTVNGITGTAVAIPSASNTASGIITTGNQTFAGIKTFANTTASTSTGTGAVLVSGGLGVAGQVTAARLAANGNNTSYNLYVNGTSLLNGNTTINGNLIPGADNTKTLGSTDAKWSKLYVGSSESYGNAYQPVYWNDGVPTVSYPVQYSTWSISSGDNTATLTGTDIFTADTYVISLVVTSGEQYLNGPITWTSAANTLTLSTAATSGDVEGYVLTSIGTATGATCASSSVTT